MFHLHHLRRYTGALALALAFAVLLSSLCPRGWFVCVHDEALVLVDGHHANEHAGESATCGAEDCCAGDQEGCLDLALSLVLNDQTMALPIWNVLPSGPVLANLPDLAAAARARTDGLPRPDADAQPPPWSFVCHIRLLV